MLSNKSLLLFIYTLFTHSLFSQTSTHSPYSRYGIGELQYSGFTQNMGKGSVAYGINTANSINFLNPASYTNMALTTFEVGGSSKTSQYLSLVDTSIINRTAFNYLALGFPITKKWGMSFGVLPYTAIGYKLVYKTLAPNGDSLTYQYNGSGGINILYLGNGFQVHKNLSLGLNVSYLFGVMSNTSAALFTTGDNNLSTVSDKAINVSDVLLNYGFLYKVPVKTNYTLTVGGTYTNKTNIHAIKNITTTRFSSSTGSIVDTIIQDSSVNGNFIIPQRMGVGISFAKNEHWLLAADVSWQQWSAFTSPFDQYDTLANTLFFAVGGEYSPNKKESSSYFNKIKYRAGINYGNSYVQLNGDNMNQYSVSFGLGFPVIKSYSVLNIGFEFGRMESKSANAIDETYGKMSIGFTLNDKWFIKRKYD